MTPKQITSKLVKGFEKHERADGTVTRLHSGRTVVAEVCTGARSVRVNFREATEDMQSQLELSEGTKSWPGGGVKATDENWSLVREALENAVADSRNRKLAESSVKDALETLEAAVEAGTLDAEFDESISKLMARREFENVRTRIAELV